MGKIRYVEEIMEDEMSPTKSGKWVVFGEAEWCVYDIVKESKENGPYPINPKILDPTMCMPSTLL